MLDRRTLLAAAPALMLTSSAGAQPGSPLRWDGHFLFLRVQVGGKPIDALIDFNARTTLLDHRRAEMVGVGPQGIGVIIDAAGRQLRPAKVNVVDLADYANFLLRGRIGMVIGRDLFAAGPWLLDLNRLSLAPVDHPSAQRGKPLPLSDRSGLTTIPIAMNGVPAQAALSFNDLDQLRVSASFAARAGLGRRRNGSAAGGAMRAGVAVDRLDIAGVRVTDLNAALEAGERGPDAWLGPAILRRFRIGIDLAAGGLWLDPA